MDYIIKTNKPTKLYDIRRKSGQEEYNNFCNGTVFAPRNIKYIQMTEKEKKQ